MVEKLGATRHAAKLASVGEGCLTVERLMAERLTAEAGAVVAAGIDRVADQA